MSGHVVLGRFISDSCIDWWSAHGTCVFMIPARHVIHFIFRTRFFRFGWWCVYVSKGGSTGFGEFGLVHTGPSRAVSV